MPAAERSELVNLLGDPPADPAAPQGSRCEAIAAIAGLCGFVALLCVAAYELAASGDLTAAIEWLSALPRAEAFGLYWAFLFVWCLLCLPVTVPEIGAGYVLGFELGTVCNSLGSTAGSLVVFLLARATPLRGWAERHVLAHFEFTMGLRAAFLEAPYATALALRFAFVPIGLQNLGAAVMPVPVQAFIGSFLADVTYGVAYAFVGAQCASLTDVNSGGGAAGTTAEYVVVGVGIVMLVLLFVAARWQTSRLMASLAEKEREAREKQETSPVVVVADAPAAAQTEALSPGAS